VKKFGNFPKWIWENSQKKSAMADQPMRIAMTIETTAMANVNRLDMGQAVTLLARGRCRMSSLVAIDTGEPTVIGCGRGQIVGLLLMTGPAGLPGKITGWDNRQRLVGGMTAPAFGLRLVRRMGFMAFQTTGNLVVPAMAAITKQLGMPTAGAGHLPPHLRVTGQAFPSRRLDRIT